MCDIPMEEKRTEMREGGWMDVYVHWEEEGGRVYI